VRRGAGLGLYPDTERSHHLDDGLNRTLYSQPVTVYTWIYMEPFDIVSRLEDLRITFMRGHQEDYSELVNDAIQEIKALRARQVMIDRETLFDLDAPKPFQRDPKIIGE